jgi:hypothetical protein
MGWFFLSRPDHGSKRRFIEDKVLAGERYECLSVKGDVGYCIHFGKTKDGKDAHEAMVILLACHKDQSGEYQWGYKLLGESVGPCASGAPKKLLDRLDKLGEPYNDNARKWRERCRSNLLKKRSASSLKTGDVVRFSSPLNFGSFKEDTFVYCLSPQPFRNRKQVVFRAQNGVSCRITKWRERDFSVFEGGGA